MNDRRDIKDLLRGSMRQEKEKTRERLNKSKTLAGDATKSPSTVNHTAEVASIDDPLLEELKIRYQRIGYDPNNLGVMRAGLQMLASMSGAELRRVMQKVEEQKENVEAHKDRDSD